MRGLAAAGHASIQDYSSQFRVVGSTQAIDARDNTGTTGTGVPSYWLNGDKVADNYTNFYDGSWSNEPSRPNLHNKGIGALRKEDFAGLSSVTALNLSTTPMRCWPTSQTPI